MTHTTAGLRQAEESRLREWNLAAVHSHHAKKHEEATQAAQDAIRARKQQAMGESQKEAVAAAFRDKEEHLASLAAIERSHRAKLMQLDEERLDLESDQAIKAVTKEHQCEMSAMAREHEQKMDIMKNSHA